MDRGHSIGRWCVMDGPEKSQVLAVHAALLHTGKIIYFGGDEYVREEHDTQHTDHTALFDCNTLEVTRISSPHFDVFCSGHALLDDGRLVVGGGTGDYDGFIPNTMDHRNPIHPHFTGLRDTAIYDPLTNSWTEAARMNPEPYQHDRGRPSISSQ